jgi:hypothetical protein
VRDLQKLIHAPHIPEIPEDGIKNEIESMDPLNKPTE